MAETNKKQTNPEEKNPNSMGVSTSKKKKAKISRTGYVTVAEILKEPNRSELLDKKVQYTENVSYILPKKGVILRLEIAHRQGSKRIFGIEDIPKDGKNASVMLTECVYNGKIKNLNKFTAHGNDVIRFTIENVEG